MSARRTLGAVAVGAALPSLYAAGIRSLLRRTAARLMAGDVDAFLRMYADDVKLVFPGNHSWGREYHGKREVEGFLRRFVAAGLQGETHEILVNGPPWNANVCVRFTDHARSPDDELVYANRAMIFLRTRWGKVVFEEAYEDTQKVAEFDEYLLARERAAGPGDGAVDRAAVTARSAE